MTLAQVDCTDTNNIELCKSIPVKGRGQMRPIFQSKGRSGAHHYGDCYPVPLLF